MARGGYIIIEYKPFWKVTNPFSLDGGQKLSAPAFTNSGVWTIKIRGPVIIR